VKTYFVMAINECGNYFQPSKTYHKSERDALLEIPSLRDQYAEAQSFWVESKGEDEESFPNGTPEGWDDANDWRYN